MSPYSQVTLTWYLECSKAVHLNLQLRAAKENKKSHRSCCQSWPEDWDAGFHPISVTTAPVVAVFQYIFLFNKGFFNPLCVLVHPSLNANISLQIQNIYSHVPVLSVTTTWKHCIYCQCSVTFPSMSPLTVTLTLLVSFSPSWQYLYCVTVV